MKFSSLITLVAVFMLAASAAFGWGSLVASYASPGTYPNGLGYILFGGVGYITQTTNTPDYVWRTYRSNGSVYGSYAAPQTNTEGCDSGIISSMGYTWVVAYSAHNIYRMGFNSGSIYSSWAAPGTYPFGIAFHDAGGGTYYVYHTDRNTNHLYRMNATSGSIYASYNLGYQAYDLAYGNGYLWISNGTRINMTTTTGSTISTMAISGGTPTGVAYDPTGPYLWVSIQNPVNRVNVYELSGVGIAPTSLGRVKAVYR